MERPLCLKHNSYIDLELQGYGAVHLWCAPDFTNRTLIDLDL